MFSAGNLLTREAPEDYRTYTGFEVTADWQMKRGGFLLASYTTGKNTTHFCQAAQDDPNLLRFCHTEEPYRHQLKLTAGVPLPWDTMISGTFQIYPGSSIGANFVVTAFAVGQPLRTPTGTIELDLLEPHTKFNDSQDNLSLRFSKTFNLGGDVRLTANVDAINIFNNDSVLRVNEGFGANWLRPQEIEDGRTFFLGVQVSF